MVLLIFFFTHIFIRRNCLLFPNHATLSAVKVTTASRHI